MATAAPPKHPYVECRPKACGGIPVIRGTRFPVRSVVECVLRQGLSPEEMLLQWPHLTLGQIHGALAYYYDHKTAIDTDMRRNRRMMNRAGRAG